MWVKRSADITEALSVDLHELQSEENSRGEVIDVKDRQVCFRLSPGLLPTVDP